MTHANIEALVFDLGGVLIDIDFNRVFAHWQQISSLTLSEIQAKYTHDQAYQQHERGEISATEYFEYLREHLQLQDNLPEIAAGWNAIFVGEISATLDLVAQVGQHYPCYAFSNTNAIHQHVWSSRFPRLNELFKQIFVSSEMGLRKPDLKAFTYVADAIGVAPESILFFDDMPENIQGAKAAGFAAVQVQATADVKAALVKLGCLL